MSNSEIISLLQACKLVVTRLAAQGFQLDLTETEKAVLTRYNQLPVGSLQDPLILKKANLTTTDINALSFLAACHRVEITQTS